MISIAKKNTELEAEVNQLRAQIEAQQEEASKKEGGDKSKATRDVPPEIMKILLKHAQNEKSAVKEFPGVKKRAQPQQEQQNQEAAGH